MKKVTIIVLVVTLMLVCIPLAVFAMDNIGATDTVQPVTSVIGQSVDAMNYSKAPDGLLPFIYSLAEEHTRLREELIGPCNCTPGYLYVKNMSTGDIALIYGAETLHYTATQDELYYVTANNTIMKTDFTGASHTALYTSSAPISELDYFDGKLCFLEGDTSFVLYDISDGVTETIELPEEATSAFLFATAKLLWSNRDWAYFYTDLNTGQNVELMNDWEVNNLVMPYLTPEGMVTTADTSIMVTYPGPDIINDLTFPFSEYPATPHAAQASSYPTPSSYFTINGSRCVDHDIETVNHHGSCNCRKYNNSNWCDGFARYVHEKFIHVSGWNYANVYGPNTCSLGTVTFTTDTIKSFFDLLTPGAFIRYSRDLNNIPYGHHSAIYVSSDDNGVWVYEANQDNQCGVFLEYYTYEYIVAKQRNCVRLVNHAFTGTKEAHSSFAHHIYCKKCDDGYIVGSHTFVISGGYKVCSVCKYATPYYSTAANSFQPYIKEDV